MSDIILPVYLKNEELLQLTQGAIATLTGRLIIIDNGSNLGENYLREKALVYIRNGENMGYPKAVNQGFKEVISDLVAICNNDIRVMQNWENVAKDIFSEDPKIGSVHFRMIDYDEPMQQGYNTWIVGKERWCTSSFFVIRKEAIQKYDENFGLGGYDDYDYWKRFRDKGWKTAYTTKSCYQHKHSSTQLALDQTERQERDKRNREYFKGKHGEYPDVLFAKTYPEQMQENYYEFFKQL